jgi:hypothetical protein
MEEISVKWILENLFKKFKNCNFKFEFEYFEARFHFL